MLPAAIFLLALALYGATLAPTVLWGDDAELQRIVVTGEERVIGQSSRASHLLWLALARGFVAATPWLPLDSAGRTNLVSALGAAVALPLVYACAVELAAPAVRRPRVAGLAAAAALGVSHTFWLLAVRPAVYTLQMALLAAATWGVLRWRRTGRSPAPMLVASLAGAAALANHVMIAASVPGLAWLAATAPWRSRRAAYGAAGVAALGVLGLLLAARWWHLPLADLLRTVLSYRPRPPAPRDALVVPAFLLYQFPLALPLAGWGARRLWRGARGALAGVVLLYTGNAALALGLDVRDRFIFFLPSYFPVALLVGVGCAAAVEALASRPRFRRVGGPGIQDGMRPAARSRSRPTVAAGAAVAAVVLAPIVVYPLAAALAGPLAARLAPARHLPGRDPVAFYLAPAKAGYRGARAYGETALAALEPGAAVVADWLPYQTLLYLQRVEGQRPDVALAQINAGAGQLRFLLAHAGARPLYLADNAPFPYYEMPEIERCFHVAQQGVVFRLTPRPEAAGSAACR